MKAFVNRLLIFGLIVGAVASCGKEPVNLVTWYIENKTGKDIVIVNTKRPKKEPVFIPNGTTYSERGVGDGGGYPGPFDRASNIDVIFNNERIINYDVYGNREAFNNPLIWDNYRKVIIMETKWRDEYEYYYTFVPEQYDMAEPYDPDEPEPEE